VRTSPRAWLAIATLLAINGAFALNNLAPYLGLNYGGAMTMYSGLADESDNHLFMPKLRLSDAGTYVSIQRAAAGEPGGEPDVPWVRRLRELRAEDGQPSPLALLDVVRYYASRACASAPGARLELQLMTEAGQLLESDNACAEPAMLRHAVLTSYPRCKNAQCRRILRSWQTNAASVE
jgi:hypothetical protein